MIQTYAEFPPVSWFDNYTFFVARGAKRPCNFLINELHSLDEEITLERQEIAQIIQTLIKLENCSTWLSWTKIFNEVGIKLEAVRNLEIYNG